MLLDILEFLNTNKDAIAIRILGPAAFWTVATEEQE
jgi:hypothetical protein